MKIVARVRRSFSNYMMNLPGEGSGNPYANVEQSVERPWQLRSRPSKSMIQMMARDLLRKTWQHRKEELHGGALQNPFEVINPTQVLKDIGYTVSHPDTLGQFSDADGVFEVAGQIDPSVSTVDVSRQFSPETMRFTAAHELGHAVLHRGMRLHRDRPLDGSRSGRSKAVEEVDADYFAACFLMPESLVKEEFFARFLTTNFSLSEAVAFALGFSDVQQARRQCRSTEQLARVLAEARFFNGKHFVSMAEQFQVSVTTMAIRLQELALVTQESL